MHHHFIKVLIFGAPEGFEFVAVTDGIITFTDFLGGGGFTITLTDIETTDGEIKYSYCHCNPNFIVKVGDYVQKGQIIGSVGSKYAGSIRSYKPPKRRKAHAKAEKNALYAPGAAAVHVSAADGGLCGGR